MAERDAGSSESAPPDPALVALLQEHDLPCPRCGYSLHRLATDRCPECGLVVTAHRLLNLRDRPKSPAWRIGAVGLGINAPLTIFGWCCMPPVLKFMLLPGELRIVLLCLIVVAALSEWALLFVWFDHGRLIMTAPPGVRRALAAFVWWPAALLVALSLI